VHQLKLEKIILYTERAEANNMHLEWPSKFAKQISHNLSIQITHAQRISLLNPGQLLVYYFGQNVVVLLIVDSPSDQTYTSLPSACMVRFRARQFHTISLQQAE